MIRISSSLLLCGLTITLFTNNVLSMLGGDAANPGQFPYQVSVENLEFSICGGAIVGYWHVVTAGHCVIDEDNEFVDYPLRVVAGVHHLASRAPTRVVIDVEKAYASKLFNRQNKIYKNLPGDIAVLKLQRPLPLDNNPFLSVLKIPEKRTYVGEKAIISGFGSNFIKLDYDPMTNKEKEVDHYATGRLRYASAIVLSKDDCQKSHATIINELHLCAQVIQRNPNFPEGVCSGDSGSPLVYNGNILIGILSTGPVGCRETETAGKYTRVTFYIDFINNAMADKLDINMRSAFLKMT